MRLTAGLAAAGLAAVDLLYVAERRISPVQAADAGLEALFIYGLMRQCRGTRYPGEGVLGLAFEFALSTSVWRCCVRVMSGWT
jgi:hypothetical protein